MTRIFSLAVAALFVTLPAGLQGQTILQAGAGGGSLTGDDFEGIDAGYSIGGGLLFGATENVQVGGEFFVHSFGVEDTDENLDQFDVLAKARYLIPGETARVFVGAKAGYARQSFDVAGVDFDSDGFTAGPTLGVAIPLSNLHLELSGDLMYVTQGEPDTDLVDPDTDFDDVGGVRWSLNAGLAIPLRNR